MSGDVQPRKRKDKKKKKDELGLEEPRGTAAALGEGDVFMHSYNDHGTGGHWCAKVIFFSLLAVLVTLIGLIILENRGLSELEANAVESPYSNILEGWLEDGPNDDHHDEHTLELKHHDDDEEDDHYNSHDIEDHEDEDELADEDEHADEDEDEHADEEEDEHADEDEDEHADEDEEEHADGDDDEQVDDDEQAEDEDGQSEDEENEPGDEDEESYEDEDENNEEQDSQQDIEEADDEDEDNRQPYKYYAQEEDEEETGKDNEDEYDEDEQETEQNDDVDQNKQNYELENEDEDNGNDDDDDDDENQTKEDEDEQDVHEDVDEDDEVEVEKIEREASEEEPISIELPTLPEEDDDDKEDDKNDDEDDGEEANEEEDTADDDFLEADIVPPVVERVSTPAGKPFVEVDEDDISMENPPDTLEEEEEYEKKQDELRKEEEQSSHHIWLKLSVGAALLVATHAVLRRATAPRDEPEEEHVGREETPVIDRRMTLISEQAALPVNTNKENLKRVVEEIVSKEVPFVKAVSVIKQESEEESDEIELEEVVEEEEIEEVNEAETLEASKKEEEEKERYSDEEEEEEVVQKKEMPKAAEPLKSELQPEPEDEEPDDVEIIDDEQLEEELEEEEDDVSDVDDAELLSRLEAKYGRLPEPERPGQKYKDGGNSVEDMWPGEPADAYWRQQLDSAERELRQGAWSAAAARAGEAGLRASARARYIVAAALDRLAEAQRDNALLSRAIAAYFEVLEMSDRLSDKKLVEVARRALDRIQFRGNYLKAEPVYRLLIRRFPNEPAYRNNMTISFLMANRNDLAENVLKETLAHWPEDRVALAHYGFILKTSHKDRLEDAVDMFQKALEGDRGPACEPRFYYHYGDALLLLGRFKEAHEVHKRAANLGHFLSASQRSLYNVPRLKSRPWWNIDETPYAALARNLERRWKDILKEGQRAAGLYKEEEEGLRERGEWSQMDLFVRGQEVPGRCAAAPVTCAAVRGEGGAAGCRRGQVKFSSMAPGTHVRPHVGPTNCRLRMHLGLSNTKNTFLRVDQETRQWQEGKVLLFDDSFEHEVWHNGTGVRLVLIVDVWHPDLTPAERRTLPAI